MVSRFLLKRSFKAIPDYEVLEKIDDGGMSVVYKGRSRLTGALVAIKVFRANMAKDPTLVKRFQQEFRATSKLLHPNIVQALAFSQDASTSYLVMEFVEGESLGQRIDRAGRFSEEEAIGIITQVAQALQYAHEHGMVHRDVKPDNVLLKGDGKTKLADFGLVKDSLADLRLTGPVSVLGTPHFMAPEQYTDAAHVDARCDIYSLAATLYMSVTGQLPFKASNALDVIKRQARNELIPPRDVVPDLSPAVDQAICAAMNPDPAQRPASCLAFLNNLRPKKPGGSKPELLLPGAADTVAAHPDLPSVAEQRASVRFPCILGTSCTMSTSFHPDSEDPAESWPAIVQDLSLEGIALLLGRRFEIGTVLNVHLEGATPNDSRSVLASIIRVTPTSYGQWLAGCTFCKPLNEDELQTLL